MISKRLYIVIAVCCVVNVACDVNSYFFLLMNLIVPFYSACYIAGHTQYISFITKCT